MRKNIIELIFQISEQADAFDILEKHLTKITRKQLGENIIECGILPEVFAHDSSEEKLWAKYSDIMHAGALSFMEIPSEVLRARGDAADVFGKSKAYSIVGDAKTFRLSRSAKNQKDFKVKALDDWRKANNYAVLASPLIQYPQRKSQIYAQAIDRNVTLLSYTHLSFLLDFHKGQDLRPLWDIGNSLRNLLDEKEHQNSQLYWCEIDKAICRIVDKKIQDLQKYKVLEIGKTKEIDNEGIVYWQSKIKEYNELPKEEAVRLLIKAEKIEEKIKTIQKAIKVKFEI